MPKEKAAKKEWKELPPCQVSDALLWEVTKNYTSYLTKNNGLTLSTDPLNLTGLNTKKDSGVACGKALGVEADVSERTVRVKKVKKKAQVVRFDFNVKTKKLIPKKQLNEVKDPEKRNRCVYSSRTNVTIKAVVKALKRDLKNYRKDLVPTALRRCYKLYNYKKNSKYLKKGDKKKEHK